MLSRPTMETSATLIWVATRGWEPLHYSIVYSHTRKIIIKYFLFHVDPQKFAAPGQLPPVKRDSAPLRPQDERKSIRERSTSRLFSRHRKITK